MTTTEISHIRRRLIDAGYVPVAPVRAHLQSLISTGISFHRLSLHIQWPSSTLLEIHKGNATLVNPELAQKLYVLTADDLRAAYPPPVTEVDEVVLERLIRQDPVDIDAKDKPVYARALSNHGWRKTHISRCLGMSGAKVNKALAG